MTRNLISALFILLAIAGCKEEPATKKVTEPVRPSKRVKLLFVKANLMVPPQFLRQTPGQIVNRIQDWDVEEERKERALSYYESIEDNPAERIHLIDTTDLSSTITVFGGEYLKLNKEASVYYMQTLERQLIQQYLGLGYEVETEETRYMEGNNWQMLKFKFSLTSNIDSHTTTQYIISRYPSTFSVIVAGSDDDLQDLIQKMEFRK